MLGIGTQQLFLNEKYGVVTRCQQLSVTILLVLPEGLTYKECSRKKHPAFRLRCRYF